MNPELQNIVNTKGYAFLTSAQKAEYNAQTPQTSVKSTVQQATQPATAPTQQPKPVSYLSSQGGLTTLNQNTQKLQTIENAYTGSSIVDYLKSSGQASDFASREKLAKEQGIEGYTGTATQNTQLLNTLRNLSGSPVSGGMVNDLNQLIADGSLPPGSQEGLTSLVSLQDQAQVAAARARAALESGDYASMDRYVAQAEASKKQYVDQLAAYYEQVSPLRQRLESLSTPTEREQVLNKKVLDIKSQIEAFNLQTEEDKFREFEGQTLGFAGGRAAEIDIKASFKRQEMALKERNLLLELGLEQDAREMEQQSVEAQLAYLAEDFDLQTKVQERIDAQEDKIFSAANQLKTESKNTLLSILDQLTGVNPDELPADVLAQLQTLSSSAGIPSGLVTEALKTQYQQSILSEASDLLSVTEAEKLGVPYGTTKTEAAKMGIQPGGVFDQEVFERTQSLRKEFNDLRTSKQIDDVKFAYSGISEGYEGVVSGTISGGIADQAIIRGFVRMTDPGSVVREGEFALSTEGQSAINAVRGSIQAKVEGGVGLTNEERKSILDLSTTLYADYVRRYNTEAAKYRSYASDAGASVDQVATYLPTAGLIDAQNAKEGDILILNGSPYQKSGKDFILLEDASSTNRPQRNNNPLNIKESEYTKNYDGVVGVDPSPATDGGKFLTFATPEAGFEAAKRLIRADSYKKLTVDAAMKRWSNNGYGGEIAPMFKDRKISELTPVELDKLIQLMAQREGYYA